MSFYPQSVLSTTRCSQRRTNIHLFKFKKQGTHTLYYETPRITHYRNETFPYNDRWRKSLQKSPELAYEGNNITYRRNYEFEHFYNYKFRTCNCNYTCMDVLIICVRTLKEMCVSSQSLGFHQWSGLFIKTIPLNSKSALNKSVCS